MVWCGFDPWPQNFHMLQAQPIKRKKKIVDSGDLSKIPQSSPLYLSSEGWVGPWVLPSCPCLLSTIVTPPASCVVGAQPQAAPSVLWKEPVYCLGFLQEASASAQARQPCWALCLPVWGRDGAWTESCPQCHLGRFNDLDSSSLCVDQSQPLVILGDGECTKAHLAMLDAPK